VKYLDVIVGAPTILNVGLLLLTPQIEFLALGLGIARQTCKIEGNTFLSSDYLLQGTCGAKIARTSIRFDHWWLWCSDSRIVLLKLAELVLDLFEGVTLLGVGWS